MAPQSKPVDEAYARLKEAGELRGPESDVKNWLGCNPESLRRRATQDGLKLIMGRHPHLVRKGRASLVLKLVPRSS